MTKFLLLSATLAVSANAGSLTEARVTRIINDVRVVDRHAGGHAAAIDEVIKNETGLQTGIQSRSELLFQDDTLTRIGPDTYFSFKPGTREMSLQRGTMLLQVPKGLGGAKIRTAAVTASITGTTIMMEHRPKRDIKVLVLEGSLRLSITGKFGDSVLLQPGNMVIMRPDAKRIPDPVTVDLARVVRTSSLVNMKGRKGNGLPSMARIDQQIDLQQHEKGNALIETNLAIMGGGTNVLLANDNLFALVDRHHDSHAKPPPILPPPLPPPPPPPPADPGPVPTIEQHGGPNHNWFTNLTYGDIINPVTAPLVLNAPQDWTADGGRGTIRIVSNDSVTVNTTLKVSDPASKHGNGEISIASAKPTGTAIAISSSAQLLALLDAASSQGGAITFTSAGGAVNVAGTIRVDQGRIDMRNNGAAGAVNITSATLHADVVKIGALGNNGTLNIGGGTIDADSTIKLYAGGSNGTVNFIDNVTLGGNSAKTIAGDSVTIFNGKTVTVLGHSPASVFTNHPNYSGFGGNGATTGTFGGQGATTNPLSAAPGY